MTAGPLSAIIRVVFCGWGGNRGEADVSAQLAPAQEGARVPGAHAHARGPQGAAGAAAEGPVAHQRIGARPRAHTGRRGAAAACEIFVRLAARRVERPEEEGRGAYGAIRSDCVSCSLREVRRIPQGGEGGPTPENREGRAPRGADPEGAQRKGGRGRGQEGARSAVGRDERLKSRREFQAVCSRGRSYANAGAVLYVLEGQGPGRRWAVAAGRRLGKAVVRNRLRRLLREAYRHEARHLPEGVRLVLVARRGLVGGNLAQAREIVRDLLLRAGLVDVGREEADAVDPRGDH